MDAVFLLFTLKPAAFVLLVFVFGLVIGSFLNVVIHRLPRMMMRAWRQEILASFPGTVLPAGEEPQGRYSLAVPRSACPCCGQQIRARDNIPLLSWLLLRGRCRKCGTAISLRYPVVELLTGLGFAWCAYSFGVSWHTAAALVFTATLMALVWIDIDEMLLPDQLTLPLLWLGLLVNLHGTFAPLADAVIGAAAGYLSLWLVYWGFKLLTGKEGMGYGDFKLLAALGAWMGWQQLPLVILLSSVVGAVLGLAMMLRRGESRPLPFGPYLAIAGWIAFFWGARLTDWYLSLMV